MKRRPARALLKASVLVLSESGLETILVKPKKRSRSWELPGGKIDAGESLPAGACREVLEETGIQVELDALVSLYKCARQDELMFLFLGHATGGELCPDAREIAEVCWEPLDSAAAKVRDDIHRQRLQDGALYCGSPIYRLIRKQPFEILESWDLGFTDLAGEQVPLLHPASQSQRLRSSPSRRGGFFRWRRGAPRDKFELNS